jgi:hypothetical protein
MWESRAFLEGIFEFIFWVFVRVRLSGKDCSNPKGEETLAHAYKQTLWHYSSVFSSLL